MSIKWQVITIAIVVVVAAAVGRWTAPEKVKIETKTVMVEKEVQKKTVDKDIHKVTTTTETKAPDGTSTKTTTVTYDDNSKTKTTKSDRYTTETDTLKEVTKSSSKLIISAMAGVPLSFSNLGAPIFGGSVQKSLLGPITIGAWYLSNSTGGLSVGLIF